MTAFRRSVWPSVWGWNNNEPLGCMSSLLHKHLLNATINWRPLLEMAVWGRPCSRNTALMNSSANPSASMIVVHGMRWRCFVNWTTITQMTSYPSDDGSPLTKSIDMSCYGLSGTTRVRSTPWGACLPVRERWQVWQFRMQRITLFLIRGL